MRGFLACLFVGAAGCATVAPNVPSCNEPVPRFCAGPAADEGAYDYAELDLKAESEELARHQPTKECSEAMRLFAQERFDEAVGRLRRVAAGETGDTRGRRQYVTVQLGISYAKLGRWNSAVHVLSYVVRHPGYPDWEEALLWLGRAVVAGCASEPGYQALKSVPKSLVENLGEEPAVRDAFQACRPEKPPPPPSADDAPFSL